VGTSDSAGDGRHVRWERGYHDGGLAAVDPLAYDRYLGRWSRLFLPALITAAGIEPGDVVLDIATGTGEAAAQVVDVLGAAGLVVAVDVSIGMLETTRARFADTVRVVAADGGALALRDASVDVVVCQLGLMFMSDPLGALVEFKRVVRPARRVAVTVLGTAEQTPIWGALAAALTERLPEQGTELHRSFACADPVALVDMFDVAGFREVVVTEERRIATFATFADYWQPIEAGVGMLPHAYLSLSEADRRTVRRDVERRLRHHRSGTALELPIAMFIAVGDG
jgi:SAM-dependent methyltransferase